MTDGDITSGLGIGGHGSDDHHINIRELSIEPPAPTPRRGFGARGTRYDEPCETCWNTTEICNHCGNCRNHCQC